MDWFHQSPSDYRRRGQPETLRDNDVHSVLEDAAQDLIREHRQRVAAPTDGPRLSVTPLLLKNLGSRLDLDDGYLLDGLTSFGQIHVSPCVVVAYSTVDATLRLLGSVVERLPPGPDVSPSWLTYDTFHHRAGVDEVVARARSVLGASVQPIMTP